MKVAKNHRAVIGGARARNASLGKERGAPGIRTPTQNIGTRNPAFAKLRYAAAGLSWIVLNERRRGNPGQPRETPRQLPAASSSPFGYFSDDDAVGLVARLVISPSVRRQLSQVASLKMKKRFGRGGILREFVPVSNSCARLSLRVAPFCLLLLLSFDARACAHRPPGVVMTGKLPEPRLFRFRFCLFRLLSKIRDGLPLKSFQARLSLLLTRRAVLLDCDIRETNVRLILSGRTGGGGGGGVDKKRDDDIRGWTRMFSRQRRLGSRFWFVCKRFGGFLLSSSMPPLTSFFAKNKYKMNMK